jgi:serine/threonine-protein phosphatase 2B regulatory subunit
MGQEESHEGGPVFDVSAFYEQLVNETNFTREEIQELHKRFGQLSNSQTEDNLIDVKEFQTALCIKSTGLAQRIFSAFDVDGSRQIDFREFVKGLSALSPRAALEEKASFCFRIYDIDKNGFIEKAELKEVLRFSLGQSDGIELADEQLDKVIDATYRKIDVNDDGRISFPEFLQEARRSPAILACVSLNADSLLKQ